MTTTSNKVVNGQYVSNHERKVTQGVSKDVVEGLERAADLVVNNPETVGEGINPTKQLLDETETVQTTRVGEGLETAKKLKSASFAIKAIGTHIETLVGQELLTTEESNQMHEILQNAVIKWFKK